MVPASILILVVLMPLAVQAEPGSAERCHAAKLRAAGVETRARLKCEKKGLDSGASATCVGRSQQRRAREFARAESRGGCVTVADSDDIGDEVIAFTTATLTVLRPSGPAGSRCTAAQLSAMGRAVRKLARAHARHEQSPDSVRLAIELASAKHTFESSFAKALAKGDCLSDVSSGAYFHVERTVARLRSKLSPVCGDNVTAPGEQCDGLDIGLCGGACTLSCTCAPPCPCWTGEGLSAAFPAGFFDQHGLGGAVCAAVPEVSVSLTSQDTCDLFLPGPPPNQTFFPRAGFVLDGELKFCFVASDLDPDNDGQCSGLPAVFEFLSSEEHQVCFDEFASVVHELVGHCL